MPDLRVDIDMGRHTANPAADVVVASVPTLGRLEGDRLGRHDPRRYKCVIIDEAHHAAAATYGRILEHMGKEVVVWGCSATLRRHDGLGLGKVFEKIVYHKSFQEMIQEKYLCRLRLQTVANESEVNLKGIRKYGNDFSCNALSLVVNRNKRNLGIVRAYKELAKGRKSVLVFAVDVAHALRLRDMFRHYEVDAQAVLGETPTSERAQILNAFRSGELPVLINCGILTEGTDIPNIDCVVMARPTRSSVLFQQMVGRGMRLHEGKDNCLVIDFVDVFDGAVGQITLPTLMGLDPKLVLKDVDMLDGKVIKERMKEQFPKLEGEGEEPSDLSELPEELRSLESLGFKVGERANPFQFFDNTKPKTSRTKHYEELEAVSSGSVNLYKISRLAWVSVSPTKYLLSIQNKYYFLAYDPVEGLWRGSTRSRISTSGPSRKRGLCYSKEVPLDLASDDLQHAVRAMDTLVLANMSHWNARMLVFRNAPWRTKPPSQKQIDNLAKRGINVPENVIRAANVGEDGDSGKILSLTRGSAANLLLRMQHGAGRIWKEVARQKDKRQKQKKKISLGL